MLFNSFRYLLVFLPIVVVGCILIKDFLGARAAQAWILFASLVFYGWSKPTDLIYLAASILANWLIARWIGQTQDPDRKRILVFGVVLNIAYLCVFKYLGFFASMALPVLPSRFHLPDLAFPLGVSFFTVTQIMYLVDCYESILPPGTLFDHMSFVAFFPYLISGPLGRAERMRHQLGNFGGTREDRGTLLARGIYHFSIGLVKKTVFASGFAQIANYGSSSVPHPHALEEWIFGFSYMLELYFDFSGYSDMAIGSATMLGIHIPRNFDAPLRSLSIIEFWTRWHISLSDFITTYLYTPILKSFESATLRTSAIATMLAMTIAGFWHGPSWNFVVFGLIHGVALATNQYWKKLFKKRKGKRNIVLPDFVCWLLTVCVVVISMIYFSSSTLGQATEHVMALFNVHHAFSLDHMTGLQVDNLPASLVIIPSLLIYAIGLYGPSSEQLAREFQPTYRNCAFAICLLLLGFLFTNSTIPVPFIYFRF